MLNLAIFQPFPTQSQAPESALPRSAGHPRLGERARPRHGAPVLPSMRERAKGGQAPCRVLCRAVGATASSQAVSTGKGFFCFVRFGIGTSSVETISSRAWGPLEKRQELGAEAGHCALFFFVSPSKQEKKAVACHVAVAANPKRHLASRFFLVRCFFALLICWRG